MTRDQAIKTARAAVALTEERHSYLPRTLDATQEFVPHEWVITALMFAVAAERGRMASELRAAADLDGFGCACAPRNNCNTCNARAVLGKVLLPMAKALDA
jgi:hypothetical protein